MKFKLFLTSLLLMVGIAGTLSAQTKIGYTNVELLLAYMPDAKTADQQLQTYQVQLSKGLKTKEDYMRTKMQEYYDKLENNGFRTEDEKKAAEKELQKLDGEIQISAQESEQRLMAKQQEIMQPILNQIQEKINEVAKEGGFTYILNQTSGMNILYGVESLDVTETLAKKLGVTLPAKK